MSEIEGKPEIITETMRQENADAISKIRSLFVDPGFPAPEVEDAGSAARSEKLTSSDQ
jgi:hypothetical protein